MKIKIIITSIIALVLAVASPFEAIAITGQKQYKVVYADTMSLESSNYTWTRYSANMFTANGTYIYSWTPQFNFGTNVEVSHNSVVYLDYAILNTNQYGLSDGCLTALGNWEVLDCQYQIENISFKDFKELNLTCSSWGQVAPSGGVKWCENWTTGDIEALGRYNTDIWTISYFKYVLRYTGGDENTTSIVNNIRLGGTLFTKMSTSQDTILIKLSSIPFFREGASVTDIYNYLKENDINQQQQEAGEQAQQDANTQSGTAEQQIGTGSQSIINGASSIIGALTDTTAGTCIINLNMGNLDLGNQNFCQGDIGPLRPIIATITNIMFAFVAFRVFAFLIGVMFGLFDEFFGTKTEKGGA